MATTPFVNRNRLDRLDRLTIAERREVERIERYRGYTTDAAIITALLLPPSSLAGTGRADIGA